MHRFISKLLDIFKRTYDTSKKLTQHAEKSSIMSNQLLEASNRQYEVTVNLSCA